MSPTYWNEEIETASPEQIKHLESERLSRQLRYIHARSTFYKSKFDEVGCSPDDISCREDLVRLPFTEKTELAASQEDGTLIGVHQCAPLEDIVRIQATGGTTGQPLRIAYTRQDIADFCEMGARALWAMGCRPGEIVFECMNYNLYTGGLSDHLTFETAGAATIPFGVGNSARLLEMMVHLKDEVGIWATPSYAVRLAGLAEDEGLDPGSIGLRKGYFSGEPGMQIPEYREKIEEAWGLHSADMYGTGELGMHSGECEHRLGVHYGGTGFVLTELIDPETTDPIPFEDGAVGEFVYTSLQREACPLLRMRSHDMMQVFTETCACGRTGFRFKVVGRSDDMFIVKGVNVFPLSVQSVLSKLQPELTGEFQIVLDKPPPIDYAPLIRIEVSKQVPANRIESLVERVRGAIARELNFNATIEAVEQGTLASEKKSRRLLRSYLKMEGE